MVKFVNGSEGDLSPEQSCPFFHSAMDEMTHMPKDFDGFFGRVGRNYVEKCVRDGSFRGETLRVAEVWLRHRDHHLNFWGRILTLAITAISIVATVTVAIVSRT